LRGDGRHHHHRVVRGRRGRRHGQPARRRHLRAPDRPDRRPHDVLRAEAGRDHRLRFHGARAAVPAQRSARRGGVARMKRRAAAWVRRHMVLSFFVVFAIFPWLVPYKSLATQVLIYGLFALGFNMLYGYTGLLSFGSAAYWGLGAYGTGIALAKLKITSVWLALGIGVGTAALGGALIGMFCLRRRGIYFAMLTLAFAQLLYFIGFHLADWTGGDDGLRGITVPPLTLGPLTIPLDTATRFYYFALVLVGLAVPGLGRL